MIRNKSQDTEGNAVNWIKVKCFKNKENPGIIQYKYSHSGECKKINNVFGKGRHTEKKYVSIMELCLSNDIP